MGETVRYVVVWYRFDITANLVCRANGKVARLSGMANRKRILIADDNPAIRAVLCRMFADHRSLEVCGEAVNGQEAVEKAATHRPELIILDLDMPAMNGLRAAKAICKILPDVPIILLTLHAQAFTDFGIEHSGITRIVPKDEVHTLVGHAEDLVQVA